MFIFSRGVVIAGRWTHTHTHTFTHAHKHTQTHGLTDTLLTDVEKDNKYRMFHMLEIHK